MAYEVKIPSVGESVSSATIARWHVGDGLRVEAGDLLATLDTDKVSTELTAEVGGVLQRLAEEGEEVSVGAVVAKIEQVEAADVGGGADEGGEGDAGERGVGGEGGEGAAKGMDGDGVAGGQGAGERAGGERELGEGGVAAGGGRKIEVERREVRVPSVGESVTSATVGKWHVEDGAVVRAGQVLVTLETDKVAQDLEAEHAGWVEVVAVEGVELEVGGLVAYVFEGGGVGEDGGGGGQAGSDEGKREGVAENRESDGGPRVEGALAREVEEKAIDVKGITEKSQPVGGVEEGGKGGAGGARVTRQKMSPLRRKVAEHLVSAQRNAALVTTFNECDMSEVMALRKAMQDEFVARYGTKLGFMSFFLKAVVDGLKEVPEINARVDGDEVVQNHFYDIGVAVGTERGLVVPVVRDCDQKSFAEIEHDIAGYAKKAREGKLGYADLQGGVFTISNGGIYGSLLSTPILSPPQSGILGMHTIQERPVAVKGQVVVRPMMYLALTYDHRLVDGKEGVTFLVRVKECIENPARMMVGA